MQDDGLPASWCRCRVARMPSEEPADGFKGLAPIDNCSPDTKSQPDRWAARSRLWTRSLEVCSLRPICSGTFASTDVSMFMASTRPITPNKIKSSPKRLISVLPPDNRRQAARRQADPLPRPYERPSRRSRRLGAVTSSAIEQAADHASSSVSAIEITVCPQLRPETNQRPLRISAEALQARHSRKYCDSVIAIDAPTKKGRRNQGPIL